MIKKVKSKFVIGFDGKDHVIYQNAEVVFENDTIIFVGKNYNGNVDETIDAGNSVLSPGFIDLDALGDIDHQLFFAMVPKNKREFMLWSEEYFDNGPKEAMTEEEESFKSLYAFSQLIHNGITTAMPITSVFYKRAGETYKEMEAAVHHAGKLGLRAYLGPSYISNMKVVRKDGSSYIKSMGNEGMEGLERAVKFAENFDGAYDGLIKAAIVPERIEYQTEDVLKKTKEEARRLNCLVRMHAAQGIYEYEVIKEKYGLSSIKYLDSIDFLDEKTLIPHAIVASGYSLLEDKSDEDLEILAKKGTSIIHCPLVYSRGGTALESFGRYKELGVKISMGTDTFPPDMLMNIRVGSAFAKNKEGDKPENSLPELYKAATLGGAKALGRDDLGKLCVGAKADMIAVSLDGYNIGVVDDPIYSICLNAHGTDVKMSIINGKTVLENGLIPGFDYEDAKSKAQAYYEKQKLSYLDRSYKKMSKDELFEPSFRHCND